MVHIIFICLLKLITYNIVVSGRRCWNRCLLKLRNDLFCRGYIWSLLCGRLCLFYYLFSLLNLRNCLFCCGVCRRLLSRWSCLFCCCILYCGSWCSNFIVVRNFKIFFIANYHQKYCTCMTLSYIKVIFFIWIFFNWIKCNVLWCVCFWIIKLLNVGVFGVVDFYRFILVNRVLTITAIINSLF